MDELSSLIEKLLENRLSQSELRRLEGLLENDPQARKRYIEQCQLHSRMAKDTSIRESVREHAPIDSNPEIAASSRLSIATRKWIPYLSSAAAVAVVGLIGLISYSNDAPVEVEPSANPVSVSQLSPQTAYDRTDFPESGNLKRPPTNFAAVLDGAEPEQVSFNKHIRPILSENCYACHGPDAESRKAELRLDIEAYAFEAHGKYEPAIVRGKPEQSPLYQRITTTDEDDIMPPPESHKSLTDAEIELVGQWIKEGAQWEGHWAFNEPVKPQVPSSPWGNNAIDAFLYRAMKGKGLQPNEKADRPTLARRLSLDLTGLPPTPDIVKSFVNDTSPNAYEKLVDRLLDSPAYGEHQARFWLDAARYADTHGLHLDNYREIWPYRDWVVEAFNENKPFDQFTVEQIAGDLLPSASLEQRLATGFNRCNPTTSEGGAIDEEYQAIYAKDRVETTATVFMGLTMGCASCHDHKFDPLSMEDFYRFSAFFNNLDGPIMDGNAYDTKPIVTIPKPEHTKSWIQVKSDRAKIRQAIENLKKERKSDFERWKADENRPFEEIDMASDYAFEVRFDSGSETESVEPKESAKGNELLGQMGEPIPLSSSGFAFNPDEAFTLSVKLKLPVEAGEKQSRIPVLEQFDGDRGWRLAVANSDKSFPNRYQITFELIHSLRDNNLISATTKSERVNPREFSSPTINITYDGSGSVAGLSITAGSRQPYDYSKVTDKLDGPVAVDAPLRAGLFSDGLIDPNLAATEFKIGYRDKSAAGPKTGSVNWIRFFNRAVHPFEFSGGGSQNRVKELLNTPEERHRDRDKSQIESYYYTNFVPEYRRLKLQEAVNDMRYNHVYDQATVSLVMKEKDGPPTARILERGEYDKPGKEVYADVPEHLGGLPEDAPKNRLGLAQWLVDPSNPLTARVTVNRFWQNVFGTGIVSTSEDFGAMGENPTHPELLDWLAITFQESGWDVKGFMKLLVSSAAYQQDSKIDPEELAIDSDNRFLARGPRYRLDGEVLRDQALYASGSLNHKVGGPPVKPYQPEGIWNAVAYSDSNTAHFQQDHESALYRRSLYTFWKRTAPPPNMVVFDAPSRENCNVRRERTNTPLQALTLMNDPQFVEAARHLAQRAMKDSDNSSRNTISRMYAYVFGSEPAEKHLDILQNSYQKFYSSFAEGRSDPRSLVQVGDSSPSQKLDPTELASMTMVGNQIMNLDSFINKY